MRIKEVKGNNIEKKIQFEAQPGVNSNTENSSNASRNSANTNGEYVDSASITSTGTLLINVNGQNYLIDVERI